MQELIEFVKDERFAHSNYTIELKAIELLEKEKEQIMNAAYYGHTIKSEFYDSETYYYQTYNQNK